MNLKTPDLVKWLMERRINKLSRYVEKNKEQVEVQKVCIKNAEDEINNCQATIQIIQRANIQIKKEIELLQKITRG